MSVSSVSLFFYLNQQSDTFIQQNRRINKTMNSMRSKSAQALLNVVESYTAGEVLEFAAQKRASDHEQARAFAVESESTQAEPRPPSSVVVIDSKMTPLEAATLLWENFM